MSLPPSVNGVGDATDPARAGRGGGEFAAIARIAARFGTGPPGELWIGDDAAVVSLGGRLVAVAADAVVAGVHADLALTSIADLGWKAIAVNVSDLAAMGLAAERALVTVSGPPATDIDGLYDGIEAAARAFSCPVVGGDLTDAPVLVVSVTVLADAEVTPPAVPRSGAAAGDAIWVSGPLGRSAAGLRQLRSGRRDDEAGQAHARPQPRVGEGIAARELGATAMIDVSDGFTADLAHILDTSGVGCELEALPVAPGATEEEAATGGEDFELVWCAPASADVAAAFAARGLRQPVRVGWCTADPATRLLEGAPIPTGGWRHHLG
jgi:thiamine-monophosphate kinase